MPRSGTTLATSVFDAHPFTVACYEPWNRVSGAQMIPEQSPQDLVERFDLKVDTEANIFVVKETTVDFRAIQWLTRFLQHNATTHRVQIVWSLRNYRHNYLSFVEGAREWWGHTEMMPGVEGYNQWVERARRATATLLTLYQKFPGAVFAYEALATNPTTTLPCLMEALGIEFSNQQLDYLRHYAPTQVRGDVSMLKNPRPISSASMKKREADWVRQQREFSGASGDALRLNLDQFWMQVQKRVVISGAVPASLMPERIKGMISHPGHEYHERFSSREDWREFVRNNSAILDKGLIDTCAKSIVCNGFKFFGKHVKPSWIRKVDNNYRETFVHRRLNSRNRAVLLELYRDILVRKISATNVRIYAPEALSGFAVFLAKSFPHFQGSEYLPDLAQQNKFAAIEHQDLSALTYADAAFDYVIVNEVFEHLPNMGLALGQIQRVLAPGGALLSTFPLAIKSDEHLVKATMNIDGSIHYLMEPEYHGDPVDNKGVLVFQIPGWNVLEECRSLGFARAEFVFLSSPARGVLANDVSGVMVLKAENPV